MRIVEVKDYREMSELLLKYFVEQIRKKPDSVLSFTTGKTPEGMLTKLAEAVNEGLDISGCVFLNLDEYVGRRDLPCSVYSFMHTRLYNRIRIHPKEIHMINGEAENQEEELVRYGEILKKYHRDIQLLGLGTNGHIGANEPGTPFDSTLFVAQSRESTIRATQELFGLSREETPTRMFTMGFCEIMEADHVILAASGASKAQAVKALVEGGITERLPASLLKTHKNCTLIVDQEAAALLQEERWNFISTWRMSRKGVQLASRLLRNSQCLQWAVTEAVKAVEDEASYCSVGYGGLPNRNGEVEMDAAYMDGDTLKVGGVMAVRDIKNPIEVAAALSKYQRNCFLAGEGAMAFARRYHFEFQNMLTPASRERFENAEVEPEALECQEAYDGHDTVCVIGRDTYGSMACGVSSSGLFLKHPGRVGDSPMIGSGFYADSCLGSAAATGVGEDIMRGCLSYAIVERMASGCHVQEACETVLNNHIARLRRTGGSCGSMSVIAMDPEGRIGAATNLKLFPFVVANMKGEYRVMAVSPEEGKMRIFEPGQKDWKEYEGD